MPDSDDIADAAAENAARGVESVTTDGATTRALDPLKQLELADKLAAREAARTSGSGWLRLIRKARLVPPGGGPE
jgi:hypothetical protein